MASLIAKPGDAHTTSQSATSNNSAGQSPVVSSNRAELIQRSDGIARMKLAYVDQPLESSGVHYFST